MAKRNLAAELRIVTECENSRGTRIVDSRPIYYFSLWSMWPHGSCNNSTRHCSPFSLSLNVSI